MKESVAREMARAIIWKIAQDEGGHILHYNDWVDDNWMFLIQKKQVLCKKCFDVLKIDEENICNTCKDINKVLTKGE